MNISRVTIGSALALALTAGAALADPGDHGHGNRAAREQSHGQVSAHYNQGRHLGRYRRLQTGYLNDSQIAYAIRNRNTEFARLRSMRSIDVSRIRIVRLTAAQKARLDVGWSPVQTVAFQPFTLGDGQSTQVAQVFGGNGGIGGLLQNLLGGILVQNAIGNATGGNGGGASSLANVLLNSGIPLSSLLGIFLGGNGILNAIVG